MTTEDRRPTPEQFERVMALCDGGAFPRATALGLLEHLERGQIDEILPGQERLHRALVRLRLAGEGLAEATLRARCAALELSWIAPAARAA